MSPDELDRLLRRAALDDPASLEALATALNRAGFGAPLRQAAERLNALGRAIASVREWRHAENGRCPSRSQPQLRDPACEICNLLVVGEAEAGPSAEALGRIERQDAALAELQEAYETERRRRYRAERALADVQAALGRGGKGD